MKSKHVSIETLGIMLALVTVGGLTGCSKVESQAMPAPSVRISSAVELMPERELRLSGTIEPDVTTHLGFSVPGTVEAVFVNEGDKVSAGQPLARLVQRSYSDAVGIAQATVDRAQDAWNRLEPLHRNKTIPEVKWVEVETALKQSLNALSIARKNQEDTVLVAPEAGVVAKRNVENGVTIAPGLPVFVLVQNHTVLATAPVPEKYIADCRVGQRVSVSVAAASRQVEGKIREIGVMADPLTRTYKLKVEVPNADEKLRIGMIADVYLSHGDPVSKVLVPPEAVRLDDLGSSCVYLLNADGTVLKRSVELGGYAGERVIVSKGVSKGDRVVVSGTPMLANGIRVNVVGE
jgi:RND family efflux transporter MFP subunit